jgi:ribosomal protein S18 acetylase RimI-like enzyme
MELLLRLAKESELDTVMSIYDDARGYEGCVWNEYYPDREILISDYESGNLYVYVSGDTVIGAISVEIDEEIRGFDCLKVNDGTQISFARVAIAKKYLNQGYAKKMVSELLSVLRKKGYTSAQILVSPKNIAAMSVYKRLGFEFYIKVEAYGEEFYLCEKLLSE